MIAKVVLGTMQNARKLVSIAESVPYEAELYCGRYIVNAKSMLGVLSMPEFDKGELHIHTDNEKECEKILFQLLVADLLMDTNDSVKHSIYDITTFGEILIDFTSHNLNEDGQMLYARNPAVHRRMLQWQPAGWERILRLLVKQEMICMENSFVQYCRKRK